MAIYDRKKNEQADDPTKPSSTNDEPKVKTDEKSGADLAALNANGPGTDDAKRDALKRSGKRADEHEDSDYVVADGQSVTTQRGIVEAGRGVSERDFSGGKERLEELVKSGTLVRKSDQRRDGEPAASDAEPKLPGAR